jgi:hypothetical protein
MRYAMIMLAALVSVEFAQVRNGNPQGGSTKFIIENEFVRVSKVDFDFDQPIPPDGPGPMAIGTAALPTIGIVLQPITIPVWSELSPIQRTFAFDGDYYADKGGKLEYKYLGCDILKYREVKIEIKTQPPETSFVDDAVKVDPKHNEALFENDRVRVVRIHFPVGQEGPIVDKRPRVIILLTDTHAQVRTPNGQLSPRDSPAGTIQWSLGGRQATINGNVGPLENIVVELKGAEPKAK